MKEKTATVDAEEIERFTRIADEWWDPHGKFKPLHRINPLRIQWILDRIKGLSGDRGIGGSGKEDNSLLARSPDHPTPRPPLAGLRLLDIGCGGGLISEPMARLGANVTGIDAGEKNISVAKLHAEKSGLTIDYRCTSAEDLQATGILFDVILALEIVEHVADVEAFVAASCGLLKPGGLIIYSTINRTPKSYALAIIGAEYILRWLPTGTHNWKKFLKPSELCGALRRHGVDVTEMTGMTMNPLDWQWRMDAKDLSVNYLVAGKKQLL